ncbi:MAG: DNA alkylation repair protein [Flavobacteriaceae bacterium]
MENYIIKLEQEFKNNKNVEIAMGQKAYMKNRFDFFGLKSPIRKELQNPFLLKTNLPKKEELEFVIKSLWKQPEREVQYFAQELLQKYAKQYEKNDIDLFEYIITQKSWWDTVDYIASNILGSYFIKLPDQRKQYVKKWIASNNMWLQRSAILFQLKYKENVDTQLLSFSINSLLGSKEFFINKAIGWSLRQYGKYNPDWVLDFVEKTALENLSKREAIRLLNSFQFLLILFFSFKKVRFQI